MTRKEEVRRREPRRGERRVEPRRGEKRRGEKRRGNKGSKERTSLPVRVVDREAQDGLAHLHVCLRPTLGAGAAVGSPRAALGLGYCMDSVISVS
jgi:hypothetical protein